MPVNLTTVQVDVTKAIDDFEESYHHQFFAVRALASPYLAAGQLDSGCVPPLAAELRRVLIEWGAGKRKAPHVKSLAAYTRALADRVTSAALRHLSTTPISSLDLIGNRRTLVGGDHSFATAAAFDEALFLVLDRFRVELFEGASNVTYPMKALLLLTGLMPAFDSQVRKGLSQGNFAGMNRTRYLIPQDPNGPHGKRISRLPFLLGSCWIKHINILSSAIAASRYPQLMTEPGRVFDVLFFMQAASTPLVSYQASPGTTSSGWYELV